ncbi:3'-5' exoribonuclease [Xanthomonas massiliensis]|uniref:3'-5' exoribonuclease n=1 Tax=Xanthomonas massiliensis TaxID=1720302 RepID=UPI0008264F8A|nr:3'-5' exoribonuclease [Xanthomonas massiliensis]
MKAIAHSTRLFLDCEWADEAGHQLVSLALVSEDGGHHFYSEVDPLPRHPTDWVRAVVYPLLQHGYATRQKADFTRALRAFLARFDTPMVLFDHATDGILFDRALAGFDLPANVIDKLGLAPFVTTILIQDEGVRDRIEAYFREHPDQARRRHDASVDAEALRWVFVTELEKTP